MLGVSFFSGQDGGGGNPQLIELKFEVCGLSTELRLSPELPELVPAELCDTSRCADSN
jgi:hypothetical protein